MPNNQKRGEEALRKLERELKSRDRKQKARPLGVVAASLVVILALVGGIYFLSTREGDDENVQAEDSSAAETSQETPQAQPIADKRAKALPDTVTCKYEDNGQDSNGAKKPNGKDISTKGTVTVSFETSQGPIEMEMDRAKAPCATNAISELAKSGYYDDTACHRMTSGALNVLQCGDPTGSGSGGPGFSFADEYPTDEVDEKDAQNPVIYPRGSVAMANSGPDTNGSQFFLNYDDSELAPSYTYFATISDEGMKTMDKIAKAGVEGGQPDGKPAEEVKIKKATVKA
ncbi:peptidylprolyl isomerase [Corynebacterium tuberculostearicum]|uniref:peptidylprolyl isomerase n=1 Tax=Corynebacterium tuberculostearicum TaxID=38304 RepID=UPI0029347620|nr:peptidylprolyl isomerase [Corynebacterium tuberculostearicum]MDV2432924.1 peptidylprolyl isomerase [Corynebacterium tuberculostearicum]